MTMNAIKPFAWGIIGTGQTARDFIQDLQFVTERACFVKAILGPEDEGDLEQFAEDLNIPLVYTDMQAFLEEAQVDAVYIAAPAAYRYPYVIRSLQGGVPVLCDTPMLLNAAQAETLIEVSNRTKVFCMEGMPLRFLPSIYVLMSILHTQAIGEIVSVRATLSGKAGVPDAGYTFPGGGALLGLGSYPIFLSLWLLGEPVSVKATGRLSPDGNDECCTCLLTFEGGRYANLECSWITDTRDEAVITGDKGTITIHEPWHWQPGGISVARGGEVVVRRDSTWEGKGLQFMVSEVLRSLDAGLTQSDLMSLTLSRRMGATMEAIRTQLSPGSQMPSPAALYWD
jgi:predicted dehydrogenase